MSVRIDKAKFAYELAKENQPEEAKEKGTELADLLTEDLQEEKE